MTIKLIVFFIFSLLLGCGDYNSENLALGINKKNNDRAQKKLLPLGATRIFEVIVTIESDRGRETKSEIVKAKVTRYVMGQTKEEVHALDFQNGGILKFKNSKGDVFIVNNRPRSGPFRNGLFSGGRIEYIHAKNLRIRGIFDSADVSGSIPESYLWRRNAINRYGFRILKYEVVERPPRGNRGQQRMARN